MSALVIPFEKAVEKHWIHQAAQCPTCWTTFVVYGPVVPSEQQLRCPDPKCGHVGKLLFDRGNTG